MYLSKILLMSTTIAIVTALPTVGPPPGGNTSKAEICKEDLDHLNTALRNESAAEAELATLNNNGSQWLANAANAAARDAVAQAAGTFGRQAAAYAAEMNDLKCGK